MGRRIVGSSLRERKRRRRRRSNGSQAGSGVATEAMMPHSGRYRSMSAASSSDVRREQAAL
jgi:hypothetical protein